MTHRSSGDTDAVFKEILEKSYYDKARDKMKQGKKKEEEDAGQDNNKDYLYPILQKLLYTD